MIIGFLYDAPSAATSQTGKWTKMAAAGGSLPLSSISLSKDEPAAVPEYIFHTCSLMGRQSICGCDATYPLSSLTTWELKSLTV